jgi:Na+-transporting methylmalonyl-CoA/oxaloacetate decarboxylase gamma subunit
MDIHMSDLFLQSLQITALGMGLVFGAIILLWGVMNLLTTLTADKDTSSHSDSAEPALAVENDLKAQAAAVAVAMALAEQKTSNAHPLPDPPTAIVPAWVLGMRTRQLYEKRAPRIQKPRKVG